MNAKGTEKTETLTIEGMSCNHCVRAVREALGGLSGVEVENVEIGAARVRYGAEEVDRNRLIEAVEEEGFTVR